MGPHGQSERYDGTRDFRVRGHFGTDGAAWINACVARWDRLPERTARRAGASAVRGLFGLFR